jgi:ATP-dependent Clp protease ATP-binding subunit ClpC
MAPDNDDLGSRLEDFGTVFDCSSAGGAEVQAVHRDRELDAIRQRFQRPGNHSFVVRGPSGSGKSAVLREFFRRLFEEDDSWRILKTTTAMMLAGTRYTGEFETRVRNLIELARGGKRVIIYFTDPHNLSRAGRNLQRDTGVGTFFAPYVESGEVAIVGECSDEDYRRGFEQHDALKRLFPAIDIDETSLEEATAILHTVLARSAATLRQSQDIELEVDDLVLRRLHDLAGVYFGSQALPGRSLHLLDLTLAQLMEDLRRGKIAAEPGEARGRQRIVLTPERVIYALQLFTGIPCHLLDDSVPLDLRTTREFFESRVLGQQEAVNAVVDLITLMKAGVTDPGKPMGVLFFVGPTGVGKTELAKALAEYVFGSPERMIRFDMSEFKDFHAFEKLIGDPHARDNPSMQAGSLTAQVRERPFSVILFDEIEKAHDNLFDLFLQLLGEGRLTDAMGRTTNFTQTVVILTSNVGSDLAPPQNLGFTQREQPLLDENIETALQAQFRPEFLNRIDRVVSFRPLSREHARKIAQRELGKALMRSGLTRRRLRIDVDAAVIDFLLRKGFSRRFGARPLKRTVERLALLPIAQEAVKLAHGGEGTLLRLVVAGDAIKARVVDLVAGRTERAPRNVAVFDPVGRKKIRLTHEQIRQEVAAIQQRIRAINEMCDAQRLDDRRSGLLEKTVAVDFWDEPDSARATLSALYQLDRLLETVKAVRKRGADLDELLVIAGRGRDPHLWLTVAERLCEVRRHVELASFSLRCHGPLDNCDAFLEIRLIDAEPAPDDVAGLIGDMYANWAHSKGFQAVVLHEDLLADDCVRQLTLLIEGTAVYGILRGEEGIHEMLYERTSKTNKQSKYVRVRVLPLVESAIQPLAAEDVVVERRPPRGKGIRVKKCVSHLLISRKDGSLCVEGRSGLKADRAAELLRELLRAELYRLNTLGDAESGAGRSDEVIRRYTLRPHPAAKDRRTGAKRSGLADLWNGDLDEFLEAYMIQQSSAPG